MNPELHIELRADADQATRREVIDMLMAHNFKFAPQVPDRDVTLLLRDEAGAIRGGLLGESYWGWLHVSILVVAQELRGGGWGARLLAAAEAEALRRGCHAVHLDTFSFQALPFYNGHGYEVFGELSDYPPGHTRYFLRKKLAPAAST